MNVVVGGGVLDVVDVAAEVEEWLRTQPQPQVPLRWLPGDGGCYPIRDVGQLADHLVALRNSGDWGV